MITTAMDGKTLDIVTENIQKLKSLFPEIVIEDKIHFEKLQAILGEYIDTDNERYNFTWHGKSKALHLAQTPSTGTLRPCIEESKDWDTTQNLYIEGDNLEVLKLLQKTYHNKVKMIYIDPPYNTGNDFVYPDDYKDNLENYLTLTGQKDENGAKISTNSEAGGRYHTNWLNMMYPRLRLARNLLTDDGIIFISIDDNEIDNLKKICNEIFGEDNAIAAFIWKSKLGKVGTTNTISVTHEYIVTYAKEITNVTFKKIETENDGRKENLRQWGQADRREDRPSMYYPITIDNVEVYPIKEDGTDGRWRVGKKMAQELLMSGCLELSGKNGKYEIYRNFPKGISIIPYDTILEEEIGTTANGAIELKSLEMGKTFDYSKPVKLVKYFSYLINDDEAVTLDFFSGSATAAHAVMQLNAEDGGNRKFIIVQLPEPCGDDTEAYKAGYKNICEIGKERIRRSGEKIKAELREKQSKQLSLIEDEKPVDPERLDIGFKVFKLDSSNLKKWNPDYDNLEGSLEDMLSNYVDGRTELDVVYEIMLKYGIDLTLQVEEHDSNGKKVYFICSSDSKTLAICLDDEITTDIAGDILKLKNELVPETMRVVFKDNGFKNDAAKTNVIEMLKQGGVGEFVTV
jgi:adenine-specific DNA-methyltransferase